MKSWWEEAEARAQRSRGPAALGQALWQRLRNAGIKSDLAHRCAYDLGHLFHWSCDYVLLVDGLLLCADGDLAAIRRQCYTLLHWSEQAAGWTRASAPGFNRLLDSLELEKELLASRAEVRPPAQAGTAAEEGKVEGRYRYYHLFLERLDLKLATAAMPGTLHLALARMLARLYEEALITIRLLHDLEREPNPRFGHVARLLLELNATWHFDLGPNLLGPGRAEPETPAKPGLPTLILLAFSSLSQGADPQP